MTVAVAAMAAAAMTIAATKRRTTILVRMTIPPVRFRLRRNGQLKDVPLVDIGTGYACSAAKTADRANGVPTIAAMSSQPAGLP